MREGLLRLRQQRDWKLWKEAMQFRKDLEAQLSAFQLDRKRAAVARKRDVEQLFAAKCRVALERSEPSQAEIVKGLVGDNSMLSGPLRELAKTILSRKGIVKH